MDCRNRPVQEAASFSLLAPCFPCHDLVLEIKLFSLLAYCFLSRATSAAPVTMNPKLYHPEAAFFINIIKLHI
jgi:hypothetical protein